MIIIYCICFAFMVLALVLVLFSMLTGSSLLNWGSLLIELRVDGILTSLSVSSLADCSSKELIL